MKASLAACILAALLAMGSCLQCEFCAASGKNCTGDLQTCLAGQDSCGVTFAETIQAGVKTENTGKTCVTSSQCKASPFSVNFGKGIKTRASIACCVGDACRTTTVTVPPAATKPNGRRCPACYAPSSEQCREETIECTGAETHCISITEPLTTDGSTELMVPMGCASESLSAYLQGALGNLPWVSEILVTVKCTAASCEMGAAPAATTLGATGTAPATTTSGMAGAGPATTTFGAAGTAPATTTSRAAGATPAATTSSATGAAPATTSPSATGTAPASTTSRAAGASPATTTPSATGAAPATTSPSATGTAPATTTSGMAGAAPATTTPSATGAAPATTSPGATGTAPASTTSGVAGAAPATTTPSATGAAPATTTPGATGTALATTTSRAAGAAPAARSGAAGVAPGPAGLLLPALAGLLLLTLLS